MEANLKIEVADVSVVLRCRDKRFISNLKQRYRHFLSYRRQKQGVYVNIRIVDKLPTNVSGLRGISPSSNKINVYNSQLLGIFDPAKRKAELQLLNKNPVESLGNFLRNIYTILFLDDRGLVLHAAGIVRRKCAYIFFGASGSGKTTISRLSSNYTILSDDHVFIKETDPVRNASLKGKAFSNGVNGSFRAFTIPYYGDIQTTPQKLGPFAIKGLFYLVKDQEVYLRRMPKYEALAKIITIPNLPRKLIACDELLGRFRRLLESVLCFELHFLANSSFWRCIDEHYKVVSG